MTLMSLAASGLASVRNSFHDGRTLPSPRNRLCDGDVPNDTVAPLMSLPSIERLK